MNIKQRFRQSIRCGTGEACLILRNNPKSDFSNDITKAALKNFAFDGQAEGNRAEYLAALIKLSRQKGKIVDCVLRGLATERENTWALDQLFELAGFFAKEGNKKAHQEIYKRYYKKIIPGSEWCGEDTILKLDGIEGLKYIAQEIGKALQKNPAAFEDSFLVDLFQKEHPKIKVYRELMNSAKDNSNIKKYLETIRIHKWSIPKRRQRSKYNYKKVKANIESKKVVPVPPNWVKDLSESDIKKLAVDFLQEKDSLKSEKYLRVFAKTKYPFDYQPILRIAKKPNKRDNSLVGFACEALQYFTAIGIRQFAIKKLEKTNSPADYLPLLVANYKKGDCKLLSSIAGKYKDENVVHSLVWGYIDIYRVNKTQECKKPLEILYGKLTCGLHRNEVLDILHKNGALSKKLLKEMKYDSYSGTRDLYKKISAKRRVH